jgi:UDP-N-acetyl-D-galactosamine dehydrogenase
MKTSTKTKRAARKSYSKNLKIIYKKDSPFADFKNRTKNIAVVGLGYVGLPLCLRLSKSFRVNGFDLNKSKISNIRNHIDPNKELTFSELKSRNLSCSDSLDDIADADIYIVTVPTPIDENMEINLNPVISACEMISSVLQKNNIVVFESTVYPGCTEDVCLPILMKGSGLSKNDFGLGYSPERIDPGKNGKRVENIDKIVSANTPETLDLLASIYGEVIDASIYKAASIKTAESAKLLENVQRDVNIALINEFSVVMNRLGISSHDVIDAASTKWNFANYRPGLVGGHCISVDPYYLLHKMKELNVQSKIVSSARLVNEDMIQHMHEFILEHILKIENHSASVLFQGITFKPNVSDLRNSKWLNLARKLNQDKRITLFIDEPNLCDPTLEGEFKMYDSNRLNNIDIVVRALDHNEFLEESYIGKMKNSTSEKTFFIDFPGNSKFLDRFFKYSRI